MVCSEYGRVAQIHVEPSVQGRIWVKFDPMDMRGAIKTQEALDSQYFDTRQINVKFTSEIIFDRRAKQRWTENICFSSVRLKNTLIKDEDTRKDITIKQV